MTTNTNQLEVQKAYRSGLTAGAASLLISLMLMSSLAWAQSSTTMAIASGVVVDSSRELVYLMEPGQLTARRLGNGEIVWQQSALVEPLGLHNDQLIVLGNRERERVPVLYRVDPATGAIDSSVVLNLPDQVVFLVEERPAEYFRAHMLSGSDNLNIAWDYLKRPLRGAPAISGINRPPKMPRQVQAAQERDAPSMSQRVIEEDRSAVQASGVIRISGSQVLDIAPADSTGLKPLIWSELRGAERRSVSPGTSSVHR